MVQLTDQEMIEHWKNGGQLLDVRQPMEFASGFLPGSIYLSPESDFTTGLQAFLKPKEPLIIVTSGVDTASLERMTKDAGLKQLRGYYVFDRTQLSEKKITLDLIIEVEADEFAIDLRFDEKVLPVDLRDGNAFLKEHVKGAISLPLPEMTDIAEIASLDEEGYVYFYSDNPYDSLTAASIVKKQGLHEVRVVSGEWQQIKNDTSIDLEKSPPVKKK